MRFYFDDYSTHRIPQRNSEESPGAFANFHYPPEQSLPEISTSSLPYRYQITTPFDEFFLKLNNSNFSSIWRVEWLCFLYEFKFQVESLENFLKFECGYFENFQSVLNTLFQFKV